MYIVVISAESEFREILDQGRCKNVKLMSTYFCSLLIFRGIKCNFSGLSRIMQITRHPSSSLSFFFYRIRLPKNLAENDNTFYRKSLKMFFKFND